MKLELLFSLIFLFNEISCRKFFYQNSVNLINLYFNLECTIDIRSDLNRTNGVSKEPLFLKNTRNQYELLIPSDGKLQFQGGESALIACTFDSRSNNLTFSE